MQYQSWCLKTYEFSDADTVCTISERRSTQSCQSACFASTQILFYDGGKSFKLLEVSRASLSRSSGKDNAKINTLWRLEAVAWDTGRGILIFRSQSDDYGPYSLLECETLQSGRILFIARLTLQPWTGRQSVPPKRRCTCAGSHGITAHKTV
jgi:hypothetical protein